jgi:beta-lactamase regulating signal transducer with metallopeptidase domain/HEAT repeat protein
VIVDLQSLAFFLLQATVLLAAGIVVTATLRRASAGARHLVWLSTLASVLALPALLHVAPLRLEVLPRLPSAATEAPAAVRRPAVAEADAVAVRPFPAAPATPVAATPVPAAWPRPTPGQALLLLWASVAVVLLARLLAGVRAVRRIVRGARPLDDPTWQAVLYETADRLGLSQPPRLVCSDGVEMPFACGAWQGTVVLPASASEWSTERRRLVLFHELAHMRRRDLFGHFVSRLACALYWFHPLVWTAARRLRAESERACDDLVLTSGTRPSDYAAHLLDIVSSARRPGTPSLALAMARRKEFEGRMLAILDPAAPRGTLGRARASALMAGLAVLFVAVAALAPTRPAAAALAQGAPEVAEPAAAPSQQEAAPMAAPRPSAAAANRNRHRDVHVEAVAEGVARAVAEADGDAEDVISGERAATLARVLRSDPEAQVRRAAVWALSRAQDGAAREAVAAALKDADDEVREMAAWSLGQGRGDQGTAALAEALRGDQSEEVRATAAWALAHRRPEDASAFLAALSDRSAKVREVAIWALGNQRLDKAPPALTTALRDENPEVRLVAAWALGQIEDPSTAPALKAAFAEEKDDEVREAVFRALVFLGDRSPELIEQALKAKDPDLRARAVQMLGGRHSAPWPWPRPEPRPMP